MDSAQPKKKISKVSKPSITIDYRPQEGLRTSYLSGMFAAPTPEGNINIAGYVERQSFPDKATVTVAKAGEGVEIEDVGGTGWVREIQSSFLISATVAEGLIEVLQEALEQIKNRNKKEETKKS